MSTLIALVSFVIAYVVSAIAWDAFKRNASKQDTEIALGVVVVCVIVSIAVKISLSQ